MGRPHNNALVPSIGSTIQLISELWYFELSSSPKNCDLENLSRLVFLFFSIIKSNLVTGSQEFLFFEKNLILFEIFLFSFFKDW